IEVFYVSPPALDDYRRWLQNWMEQQQAKAEAAKEPSVDDGDDGHDGDDVAEEEEGQEEAEADAETQ
ncbi:MAG: hypothetical protein IIB32_09750, partial [Chloroflexi bacterium]|nr:hypothetical protein [Chloroflexota bacterium]